jgi:hypothetical protein
MARWVTFFWKAQLLKKFSILHGIKRIISIFTWATHWPLYQRLPNVTCLQVLLQFCIGFYRSEYCPQYLILFSPDNVTEILVQLTGGSLGVNKTLDNVRQWYYWLHARTDIERWCQQCDTCAPVEVPENTARPEYTRITLGSSLRVLP